MVTHLENHTIKVEQVQLNFLLLDYDSTFHVVKSRELLTDINTAKVTALIHSNGVSNRFNLQGHFGLVEGLWYDPKLITKILFGCTYPQ